MTSSDEEMLEDVVLELMRGTGFLGTNKGQIAKFINLNFNKNNSRL
jgi:hypothetical protein